MNTQQALLSNEANYTVFRFGDKTIRFSGATPGIQNIGFSLQISVVIPILSGG